MQPEQIATLDHLPVYRQFTAEDDLVQFLEATTWGTDDTQYEHYYARHHLLHIPHPHIFTLRDGKEILGAVVLCRRTLRGGRKAYYIRYFAASPRIKGKGMVSRISPAVMDFIRSDEAGPVVFYASTEYYNRRVRRITQDVGFSQAATTRTLGFSRYRPGVRGEVSTLSETEFTAFLPRLEDFYADYAFWMTDNLGIDGQYFVLREKGEIIAGVQVHRGFWQIDQMGGFVGRFLLPLVPYTPVRRILNPRAFHFLAFEGIYAKAGQEHRLQDLFETLLHRYEVNSALFWMTESDPLLPEVLNHNRMGLLNAFLKQTLARYWVSFHQVEEKEQKALLAKPFYISSLDYI